MADESLRNGLAGYAVTRLTRPCIYICLDRAVHALCLLQWSCRILLQLEWFSTAMIMIC